MEFFTFHKFKAREKDNVIDTQITVDNIVESRFLRRVIIAGTSGIVIYRKELRCTG